MGLLAMERKTHPDIKRFAEVRNLPYPVKRGKFEIASLAFDLGYPPMTHPFIIRGLIMKPHEGDSYRIKARGCEINFKWFMNEIPPNVRIGKRCTLLGDLLSANLGTKFKLEDCIVINYHTNFIKDFKQLIAKHCLNVNTYIEKPVNDLMFIKG